MIDYEFGTLYCASERFPKHFWLAGELIAHIEKFHGADDNYKNILQYLRANEDSINKILARGRDLHYDLSPLFSLIADLEAKVEGEEVCALSSASEKDNS